MQQVKTLQHLIKTLETCIHDGYAQKDAHNPEFIHLFEHALGLESGRIVEISQGCGALEQVLYVDFIMSDNGRACIYVAETQYAKLTAEKLKVSTDYFLYVDDLKDDGMLNGEPSPMSMVYQCDTIDETYAEFHQLLLNHLP
ncbi:hypothetical protein [Vibrio crassostreae]|uniref:hypothetical protein n=1 Tax=Vibrio crassostreae TaxID=246167 RepID=UPI001B308AA0|nr:hypothetical protein [Vibrio crassostreae]